MGILIPIDDPAANDPTIVGNKFRGIARLFAGGFLVPDSFAVPADVVTEIAAATDQAVHLLDKVIGEAKGCLNLERGIAVRSSSMLEDQARQSGAGRFLTVLPVKGTEELKRAVLRVAHQGEEISPDRRLGRLSIILQQMVFPDAAGVLFSRHPVSMDKDLAVIEAVTGLGDKLVSGEGVPTRIVVDSHNEVEIAGPPLIEAVMAVRMKTDARTVESLWGHPVDIEFAIESGRLFLLQARPITSASKARPDGVWTRTIVEDVWGDRLCTLDESLIKRFAPSFSFRKYLRILGIVDEEKTIIEAIDGYLYLNTKVLQAPLSSLPRGVPIGLVSPIFPPGPLPKPRGRLLPFTVRALWLLITCPEMNPLFSHLIAPRRAVRIKARLAGSSLQRPSATDLMTDIERLCGLFADLLQENQGPYFFAFLFSWLTEHLSKGKKRLGIPIDWSVENTTSRMAERLAELGQALANGGEPDKGDGLLEAFLEDYGFRSESRSIAEPRWAEQPELVRKMALSISGRSLSKARQKRRIPILALPVALLAREYASLREELRSLLDRILFEMRKDFQQLDRQLELGGRIYSMSLEEIARCVRARDEERSYICPVDDIPTANERLSQARGIGDTYPPRFFIDGRSFDPSAGTGLIEGIPTSAGRARGRARVVGSFDEAMKAGLDEILIARNMGPAWSAVLSRVSGVILSEGSVLDHFSIVAREFGVPCIVGVGEKALQVGNGTIIEMDGYEGTISFPNADEPVQG